MSSWIQQSGFGVLIAIMVEFLLRAGALCKPKLSEGRVAVQV
jgi:hypothetical protein